MQHQATAKEPKRHPWNNGGLVGRPEVNGANSHGNARSSFTLCENDVPTKESVILSFKGKISENFIEVFRTQMSLSQCVFFIQVNKMKMCQCGVISKT